MPQTDIIYTPDADKFRLDDVAMHFSRHPDDPEVIALRKYFGLLRQAFPGMPTEVGVVTYNTLFKRDARERLENRKQDKDFFPKVTSYAPLDVMDAVMKLKDEDISNPITLELVYRSLNYILMDPSVGCDRSLPPEVQIATLYAPNMPFTNISQGSLLQLQIKLRQTYKTAKL
jgi:hypothetical protein